MSERDVIIKGLMEGVDLLVAVAFVPTVAQEARERHALRPVSAALLGQAFAAAGVLTALQKGEGRVNLQLECDGVLRGLFVDAGGDGTMRGYVKNTLVEIELGEAFRWRGAFGNSGSLSVLRDIGHEYYRSSIDLQAFSLAGDLNRYFDLSDQVKTQVAIGVAGPPDEPLLKVAAVLVQALPTGDVKALEALGATLQGALDAALAHPAITGADALFERLFPGLKVTERTAAAFSCSCSKERMIEVLASLGKAQVQDIIDTAGSTSITCRFCATKHEISLVDLYALLERLNADALKN
ncbi:MAG: Hsp33 family molecular chaperone HslO [Myxococcus sp.]|nr:Hsp33 family molecular chaperone HslO [Myxococcus sp.]